MTMRDGLNFVNAMGFDRVEAESASLDVINFYNGQSQWDAASAIFAKCVDTTALSGKVSFKHCFRSANMAAHELARYCFCNKNSLIWTDEAPDCLVNKLVAYVTLV